MSELVRLIQGSAHHLPSIDDGSVQCIVTSPPYFALRSYAGEQQVEWPAVEYAPMFGLPPITIPAMKAALGLEPTIEAYVGHLMLCLREWRRVLRADGTLWVNLGDSFSTGSGRSNNNGTSTSSLQGRGTHLASMNKMQLPSVDVGLPPKNLMMIPARFALAAQAEGWYVRSDIIWSRPNAMPESVTSRPTKSHEYIYLLSKSPAYFYDNDAIKEQATTPPKARDKAGEAYGREALSPLSPVGSGDRVWGGVTRNKRTVWTIATRPSPVSHYAMFPEEIPETCILAGTSERGCCPQCGAPWERIVERQAMVIARSERAGQMGEFGRTQSSGTMVEPARSETVGWQPTCKCDAGEPVPCVVLDAFAGSGTTLRVAIRLGRRAIGVDISQEYLEQLAPERLKVQMELLGTR